MKAVVYTQYGCPEVLKLQDVEKPTPRDTEVLVKVHAASVNSWDWDLLRGQPFLVRMGAPFRPKYKILGADVAGRVEAIGRNVDKFVPGDEVFGDLCDSGWGCFAEYVCAHQDALALKSPKMSFEQAAAIPQAGCMAVQGLRDKGEIKPGQKVLLNGAGGGVGTFAVQYAKFIGAHVTGVDSARKLDMLRSIGADEVIDYTQEDFVEKGQRYDVILDVVSRRSVFAHKRALSPNGIYVMIGGATGRILQHMALGPLVSERNGRKIRFLPAKPNKGLDVITKLFEAGRMVPVVDRLYELAEVPDALQYVGDGLARGKVVVTVGQRRHG